MTILHVTNPIIEFDDEEQARGIVYSRGEAEVGEERVVQGIQYRDTYEHQTGGGTLRESASTGRAFWGTE